MERNTHLTPIEVARYAEYLMGMGVFTSETLGDLTLHLEECRFCRSEVMECCDVFPLVSRLMDADSGAYDASFHDSAVVEAPGEKRWFHRLVIKMLRWSLFARTLFRRVFRRGRKVLHLQSAPE